LFGFSYIFKQIEEHFGVFSFYVNIYALKSKLKNRNKLSKKAEMNYQKKPK